jgi:transcriptional regulator with XRE-family HTH domain
MDTQKRDGDSSRVSDVDAAAGYRDPVSHSYAVSLGERIRTLRGKMTRAELAGHLGVHVNTVGKFERGDSMPDAFLVHRMCALKGACIEWLITGHDRAGAEPPRSVQAVEHGSYIYVPLFDVQASAGNGAFVNVERVIAMRPFDAGYIRNDLHIAHKEIALVGIVGSSSEPVLRSGDTVLVDLRDREVQAEGLHLLRIDDALLVKLVQRLPGRAFRISSSNEKYQAFDIRLDEEGQTDINILGRVRWGGVTFH